MSYVTSESLREELRRFTEETFLKELSELGVNLQQGLREELRQFLQDLAIPERDAVTAARTLLAGTEPSSPSSAPHSPTERRRARHRALYNSDAGDAAGSDSGLRTEAAGDFSRRDPTSTTLALSQDGNILPKFRPFVAGKEIMLLESELKRKPVNAVSSQANAVNVPNQQPPDAPQESQPPAQSTVFIAKGKRSSADIIAARQRASLGVPAGKANSVDSDASALSHLQQEELVVIPVPPNRPPPLGIEVSPSASLRPPAANDITCSSVRTSTVDGATFAIVPGQLNGEEVDDEEDFKSACPSAEASRTMEDSAQRPMSRYSASSQPTVSSTLTQETHIHDSDSHGQAVRPFLSKHQAEEEDIKDKRRSRIGRESEWYQFSQPAEPWWVRARRMTAKEWCSSPGFEYSIVMLVLLNAATIGVQTDYLARKVVQDAPLVFGVIDKVFCILFTAELAVRLYAFRCSFFFSEDWKWNLFDTTVVVIQLSEELLHIIALSAAAADSGGSQFSFMRVMRILRLIRIVRLVRVLRLINELRTIVDSIAGSMRSLCWTLVLLLLIIYIIGVYITQLVTDHRAELRDSKSISIDDMEDETVLEHFFSSLVRAILSLYQAMTGGVDWDTIVVPLIERINPLTGIIFVCYIAFAVLAFMNVITGVFVEAALKSAKDQQDVYIVHHARELFQNCDADHSGKLSWDAFHDQLNNPEMQMYFRLIDVDPKEAEGLFKLLDLDESGEVDYEEFLNGCLRLRGNAKAIDLVTVMIESRKLSKKWARHARTVEEDLHNVQDMLDLIEDDLFQLSSTGVQASPRGSNVAQPGARGSNRQSHVSSYRGSRVSMSRRSASVRQSQDHVAPCPELERGGRHSSVARKSHGASIRFTDAMQLSQEDREILKDDWTDLA